MRLLHNSFPLVQCLSVCSSLNIRLVRLSIFHLTPCSPSVFRAMLVTPMRRDSSRIPFLLPILGRIPHSPSREKKSLILTARRFLSGSFSSSSSSSLFLPSHLSTDGTPPSMLSRRVTAFFCVVPPPVNLSCRRDSNHFGFAISSYPSAFLLAAPDASRSLEGHRCLNLQFAYQSLATMPSQERGLMANEHSRAPRSSFLLRKGER